MPAVASIRRMIARDSVVLPQPDSPTSPSVSPSSIESVTSLTACTRADLAVDEKPLLDREEDLEVVDVDERRAVGGRRLTPAPGLLR